MLAAHSLLYIIYANVLVILRLLLPSYVGRHCLACQSVIAVCLEMPGSIKYKTEFV